MKNQTSGGQQANTEQKGRWALSSALTNQPSQGGCRGDAGGKACEGYLMRLWQMTKAAAGTGLVLSPVRAGIRSAALSHRIGCKSDRWRKPVGQMIGCSQRYTWETG